MSFEFTYSKNNYNPIVLCHEDNNKYCLEEIERSHPSDYIYLTDKEDNFLIDLWETSKKNVTIPSDIFFAKTIPLTDCIISVDESAIGGIKCKYRVVIFNDYKETVDVVKNNDIPGIVGAVYQILEQPGLLVDKVFFLPIVIARGHDCLGSCGAGYFNLDVAEYCMKTYTQDSMGQLFITLMETWYGIQIALLHPAVCDVFKYPQITKEPSNPKSNGKHQRKTKYIRKHYLTVDKLEAVSNTHETRKINRKCLAWYVIGHWRTYKNGTTTFIMPYWKGVLRNVKKNADGDIREREINIEWDSSIKSQEQEKKA